MNTTFLYSAGMQTFFVSDLHLKPERLDLAMAFLAFLQASAGKADALYILGDLFEYWIGDDAANSIGATPVLHALQQASAQTDCYFIPGNRDFLVGQQFEQDTGFTVLADETVVDLYGTPTLLLHGDSLCTDDVAHMQFRADYVNNPQRKQAFLSLPIAERIQTAQQARAESGQHKAEVSMEIMDVSPQSVDAMFAQYGVKHMIHGHTHRQHIHQHANNATRYVLGDWDVTTSIMTVTQDEWRIDNTPITT